MLRHVRTYRRAPPTEVVTDEGSRFEEYLPETAVDFVATIYPASGKRVLEVYGHRSQEMLTALTVDGNVRKGDAVFIGPDVYKVVHCAVYSRHFELDLERI